MRNSLANPMASTMPMIYMANITAAAPSGVKKARPTSTYIGRRAPQLISGSTSMVVMRSRRFSSTRVPNMPGTVQPKPISMGIKLLPCRPTHFIRRSTRKAARAI